MEFEHYLRSLSVGVEEPGEFTIAPERAKALLAGKALPDVWAAWACLAQGLLALDALSFALASTRQEGRWQVGFPEPRALVDLLRQERFLLGWLNLGWFGSPRWKEQESELEVIWHGGLWRRYRMGTTFPAVMQKALRYAPIPVSVGPHRLPRQFVPPGVSVSLYPTPVGRAWGMELIDGSPQVRGLGERRRFPMPGCSSTDEGFEGASMAAYAFASTRAEVVWVSQGVVVAVERDFLELPGVQAVISLEAAGLETDLSGLSVVKSQAYHDLRALLRSTASWIRP